MLIIWILLLSWVFAGVAIGADAFMTSIENITSQTRITTVTIKGDKKKFHTKVWNDTVANLTLMALGSSAPEILLSVIETGLLSDKGPMYAGDLGPSTIVGSAAFNLMVIIGVCVVALPEGETRTLKHLPVFAVTASFSIFAYLWLVVVLVFWTPNLITLTEAIITLAFMIILVAIAYAADRGLFSSEGAAYASKGLRVLAIRSATDSTKAGEEPSAVPELSSADVARYLKKLELGETSTPGPKKGDVESGGEKYASGVEGAPVDKDGAKLDVANMTPEEIAKKMLEAQEAGRQKTRSEHRAKALKGLTGGMTLKKSKSKQIEDAAAVLADGTSDITLEEVGQTSFVGFTTSIITVTEGDDAHAVVTVARNGCMEGELRVSYKTKEGSATPGSDYTHMEGQLVFTKAQPQHEIKVPILDDDEIEDDEEFYIVLEAAEMAESGSGVKPLLGGPKLYEEITVCIKDDDALPGTIGWKSNAVRVVESEGSVVLTVERRRGHNGAVSVKYDTKPKEALEGTDYIGQHGTLEFAHGEMSKTITVEIVDDNAYEKDERFLVILSEPSDGVLFRDDTDGRDESDICTVTIESDGGVRTKVDRVLMLLRVDKQHVGKCSDAWCDQLKGAVTIEEEQRGSPKAWFMHAIMLPWKTLFALMPPPDCLGGWGLFWGALGGIGLQVVIIGDLASQLGCLIGFRDSVTAITIVALGTSLPDLFASMQAARDDPTADNSVGNVTGSNSVNVFMGLGVPWVMATIYWKAMGPTATWKSHYPNLALTYPDGGYIVCAGSLAFSVVVFSVIAIFAIGIILARRWFLTPRQELGGNKRIAQITAGAFVGLWFLFLAFAIVRAEELVPSFNGFMQSFTQSADC